MKVFAQEVQVNGWQKTGTPLGNLQKAVTEACGRKAAPIRVALVVEEPPRPRLRDGSHRRRRPPARSCSPTSVFDFRRRTCERTNAFNAVMLIPTGVDCAIGGHAGDATPAARLLASLCDNLVLHPNVVNASDVNEQTENCLYVEGSLICRLMMGTVGLPQGAPEPRAAGDRRPSRRAERR